MNTLDFFVHRVYVIHTLSLEISYLFQHVTNTNFGRVLWCVFDINQKSSEKCIFLFFFFFFLFSRLGAHASKLHGSKRQSKYNSIQRIFSREDQKIQISRNNNKTNIFQWRQQKRKDKKKRIQKEEKSWKVCLKNKKSISSLFITWYLLTGVRN